MVVTRKHRLPKGVRTNKFFQSSGKKPDGTKMSMSEIAEDYLKHAGWIPQRHWKRPEIRIFDEEEKPNGKNS